MQRSENIITPLRIIEAIRSLTDGERETLALLADKELAEELTERRKAALTEIKNGTLIDETELFRDI